MVFWNSTRFDIVFVLILENEASKNHVILEFNMVRYIVYVASEKLSLNTQCFLEFNICRYSVRVCVIILENEASKTM